MLFSFSWYIFCCILKEDKTLSRSVHCERKDGGNTHTHTNKKQESLIDFSGNIWQYSMHEEKSLYSDFLTALLCGSWISCQRVWSQKQRLCTESVKEWVHHSQHLLIICWISYWPSLYSEGKLALRENSFDTVYSSQTDDKYT